MPTKKLSFENRRGFQLAGRIDLPADETQRQ